MKQLLALVGVLLATSVTLPAQAPAPPAPAKQVFDVPIDHVGLIVRDIKTSAKAYAEVLGLPVPAIQTQSALKVKTAVFALNGVTIELNEPTAAGPYREYLEKHGEGLHHIGLSGLTDVAARAAIAVANGGKQLIGGAGAKVALVDLTSTMGFTLELNEAAGSRRKSTDPTVAKFADNPVLYISMIVADAEKSAAAFAAMTGVTAPAVRDAKIQYPEDFKGNRAAHPKLGMIAGLPGISVAYTSPVDGPSPWSENLAKHGPQMHHLGISIKGHPEQIAFFQSHGATVLVGGGNLGYSWVGVPKLSSIFELNGK